MLKIAGSFIIAILLSLLFLASCTSKDIASPEIHSARILIENYMTNKEINAIYYREAGTITWSANLLSSSIPPKTSRNINVPADSLDLLSINSRGDSAIYYCLNMSYGGTLTCPITDFSFHSDSIAYVVLANESSFRIDFFSYRISGTSYWQDYWYRVDAGNRDTIPMLIGTFDFCAGTTPIDTVFDSAVILSGRQYYTWTITDIMLRGGTVRIINNSSNSIYAFYYRYNGDSIWIQYPLLEDILADSFYDASLVSGIMDLKAIQSISYDTCIITKLIVPIEATNSWVLTDSSFNKIQAKLN